MPQRSYYWINVFTTQQDQGNPLPVVMLEEPLSKTSMQQIAKMFNQSETVFIEAPHSDCPELHIYTPMQELPFAGHPIIGALEVLNNLRPQKPVQQIRCAAGVVSAYFDTSENIHWIKAPATPTSKPSRLTIPLTSEMLGLEAQQILHPPRWVNSGSEQLLVQIKDAAQIDQIKINLPLFEEYATLYPGRSMIYLWAESPEGIYARYLYLNNGALLEDSGTGSAAANLGGWHLLQNSGDIAYRIQQGTALKQECIIYLKTIEQAIWIGGKNHPMGKGDIQWQD